MGGTMYTGAGVPLFVLKMQLLAVKSEANGMRLTNKAPKQTPILAKRYGLKRTDVAGIQAALLAEIAEAEANLKPGEVATF